MIKMYRDGKSCTADSLQITAMKAAGWSDVKPKKTAKKEAEKKTIKKTTKKVTVNRLKPGTKAI